MSVLEIVRYGDPILRKRCSPVVDFSALGNLIEDMFDTMYEEEGVGLAANQVGIDMNLFIIDVTHTEEAEEPHVFINGIILETKGESIFSEGCLSIPGIKLDVKRPEYVKLQYQTLDREKHIQEFGGLFSRAIQHEIDHVNGVFIVDRVSDIVKMQFKKDLKEIERESKLKLKEQKLSGSFIL